MRVVTATPHLLIVDDHAIVRMGVRHLLGSDVRLSEASTLAEARALLLHDPAELMLLDLRLDDVFGLDAIAGLRRDFPAMKIIVLTSLDEKLYAERALRAGASGYAMKTEMGSTLQDAMATVLAGEIYVSAPLRSDMLRRLASPRGTPGRPELSPRETEVLRLVAEGLSTCEMAERLNRSVKTIETHKQALKTKLNADTPAMLLKVAMSWFKE
jgi:two-component system, NarL family, response regulator FusR